MIFSVSNSHQNFEFVSPENIDVYCFFKTQNSIQLPVSSLKIAIMASLRLKKEVLLLKNLPVPQAINKNLQWQASDHWLWLPPRSSSIISEAWSQIELETSSFEKLIYKLKQLKSGEI